MQTVGAAGAGAGRAAAWGPVKPGCTWPLPRGEVEAPSLPLRVEKVARAAIPRLGPVTGTRKTGSHQRDINIRNGGVSCFGQRASKFPVGNVVSIFLRLVKSIAISIGGVVDAMVFLFDIGRRSLSGRFPCHGDALSARLANRTDGVMILFMRIFLTNLIGCVICCLD